MAAFPYPQRLKKDALLLRNTFQTLEEGLLHHTYPTIWLGSFVTYFQQLVGGRGRMSLKYFLDGQVATKKLYKK